MLRELLRYELPDELIARRPPAERDAGRLLVVDPAVDPDEGRRHSSVRDLPGEIAPGSLVVVNDTRVVRARLLGKKAGSGGRAEVFLVTKLDDSGARWRAMGRASKPLRAGVVVEIDAGLTAHIDGKDEASGLYEVTLTADGDVEAAIDRAGHVPLPPYLGRDDEPEDRERYQTVFARTPGAVAAPTAGLHLSEAVFAAFAARDIAVAAVTLHVGLGTFQPVTAEDLDDHAMHTEAFVVPEATARAVAEARARGAKIVAIGTTVVRTLESAADPEKKGEIVASAGETRLLIQPGYAFRVVDQLLTNFHLPESTLLALVSAFAGRERVLAAYAEAVRERYRFFSYGDAMFLKGRAS